MAEAERPRVENTEDVLDRKADEHLRKEMIGLEYKNISQPLNVFIILKVKFTQDPDWIFYQNKNFLKSKAREYQVSIVQQLQSLGKTPDEFRQFLLFNKMGAQLTPTDIRALAQNEKVESMMWNNTAKPSKNV